ncbi:DNA polymerase [Burkholderia lata]|uniref:Type-4 uracil-DNA glycosylase n=1 Tax=Burkholderia lata (strain ATCC 17760 / DSM 23089 / LMG 22485 / NCIMB 9086 / R18194 / 383) TaxID=482957 RepID=A0A6P2ZH23_BURL3|nr:uracil-DNA glycosylase [Burkholderia lata]VWD33684.1 DNA polymerase [Burkholderia lata]
MAWAEAALEEMGLAQIWVRRGQSAAEGADGGAAAEAHAAAQTNTADAAPAVATERPARTVRTPVPSDAPPAVERSVDASPAREPTAAPSRRVDDGDRAPAPVAPVASTDAMPPMDDMPPAGPDDFAWFDAAPPGDPVPMAESRPVGTPVAALDWDALAARVSDCTLCRLCEKRTNTVFGVGDREADWMLIGEAPGENEDKQGEPFVGQAGKLLDNMLQSLSLKRGDNVYIANVIKCRPPGNRNPEPDEVASCEPYLQRQVALVKPKLIVALGRFAAQTLLKSDASIASLRGRVHAYEGVPVIVTYHPAYLLRSLQDKSKAWADLCLARDTFQRAEGADANGPAGQ